MFSEQSVSDKQISTEQKKTRGLKRTYMCFSDNKLVIAVESIHMGFKFSPENCNLKGKVSYVKHKTRYRHQA
jgi:hypothetical protein